MINPDSTTKWSNKCHIRTGFHPGIIYPAPRFSLSSFIFHFVRLDYPFCIKSMGAFLDIVGLDTNLYASIKILPNHAPLGFRPNTPGQRNINTLLDINQDCKTTLH